MKENKFYFGTKKIFANIKTNKNKTAKFAFNNDTFILFFFAYFEHLK